MEQKNLLEEFVQNVGGDLYRDAVGLWAIVGYGEFLHLDDAEMEDFIRRSLQTLLRKGARPVTGATDNIHIWQVLDHYGTSPDEIIEAVVEEWKQSGRIRDPGGVWFATPEIYEELK